MSNLIRYFLNRPIIVNAIMFSVLLSAYFAWQKIGKEEMPEFAFSTIRIGLVYPGAAAEDVELFLIKPVEEKLKGISGIKEVKSTASYGRASFNVAFEPQTKNLPEKIQELKDNINSVSFPREVDEPTYRQFKSSEKAIIDVGVYLEGTELLDLERRQLLQKYVQGFKNKVLSLPEISGVNISGYLQPELQIKVDPNKLKSYEISLNQVSNAITSQHVRRPIGNLLDQRETEISVLSELADIDSLKKVVVSSGFSATPLHLSQVAQISHGFERNTTINKVQGHEGIVLNIQKSQNTDILSAKDALVNFLEEFQKNNNDPQLRFVLIDDESYDVKNRLELIGSNGLIGFLLIVFVLFCFLDLRTGLWVAMGIPFSLAITLILTLLIGYTVNNMTLAAIIIVLGIVVDDAIIIAENMSRFGKEGDVEKNTNAVKDVTSPVIASVLTTCVAFIPLLFFTGRFGLTIKYIPAVIFLMLLASIVESFFILPAHISHKTFVEKMLDKLTPKSNPVGKFREKINDFFESIYGAVLKIVLKVRFLAILAFIGLLYISYQIFVDDMKYVMFPREETREFRVKVVAPRDTNRFEMAKMVRKVEDVFLQDSNKVVTSVSTSIGQNHRGGEVKENEAFVSVEIVPKTERDLSLNELFKIWQTQTDSFKEFDSVRFLKSRFGSDSGSPIALEIQENDDATRRELVDELKSHLEQLSLLENVEVERPITKFQQQLIIKKDIASRLEVKYIDIANTLRSYIEGDILYKLNNGDEEIDVRFTSADENKTKIENLLKLTVPNKSNSLVPIKNLVEVKEFQKPANIQRVNYKRATMVYADIKKDISMTPLEIAELIEREVLPNVLIGKPYSTVLFRGEIEDSRDSQSDFLISIILVIGLIYLLLIFLFDSFITPLLIGAIIPFGIVGTVLAFHFHNMDQYGFFAVVGTLGMLGVVINDSIVLVDKLTKNIHDKSDLKANIVEVSVSRLRAIVITTVTTVAGLFPTAYGLGGYDSMLSEMMLAMGWGLIFGMFITLFLVPCIYSIYAQIKLPKQV